MPSGNGGVVAFFHQPLASLQLATAMWRGSAISNNIGGFFHMAGLGVLRRYNGNVPSAWQSRKYE
jgi:hypothetical protein